MARSNGVSSSATPRLSQKERERLRLRKERRDIKFFLAGVGFIPAQIALNEMGVHGSWVLYPSIATMLLFFILAVFFDKIVAWRPSIQSKLSGIANAPAFFVLILALLAIAWIMDAEARITTSAVPGGSYQSPQAQSLSQESLPFIPTHARLAFPIEGGQASVAGEQNNIWRWNAFEIATIPGQSTTLPQLSISFISLVFDKSTKINKISVHSIDTPGRPLPSYTVVAADPRTALLVFQGSLRGFSLDITNE